MLSCSEVSEIDRTKLTRLSFLNLFTIVNGKYAPQHTLSSPLLEDLNTAKVTIALYSLAFQHSKSIPFPGTMSALRGALRTWKTLWDARSNLCYSIPEIEGMEVAELSGGFMQHAPEIKLLAEVILEQVESMPIGGNRHANKGDCQQKHKLPDKYDQTSMQQVADLVCEFQNLRTD